MKHWEDDIELDLAAGTAYRAVRNHKRGLGAYGFQRSRLRISQMPAPLPVDTYRYHVVASAGQRLNNGHTR